MLTLKIDKTYCVDFEQLVEKKMKKKDSHFLAFFFSKGSKKVGQNWRGMLDRGIITVFFFFFRMEVIIAILWGYSRRERKIDGAEKR